MIMMLVHWKLMCTMVSVEDLETWVFEYSAKNRYYSVLSELCCREEDLPYGVKDIWMILATVGRIVDSWDVKNFELAVELVEWVYTSVGKCVPFKIFAKLTTGLKMKILLCQLLDGQEDVIERLFCFFPRKSPAYPDENQMDVSKLRKVHSHFRKEFLTLVAHEHQRQDYFRNEYAEKYGDRWVAAVKLLMNKFIQNITKHLPLTMIEKVLRDGPEQHVPTQPFTTLATEMFLEVLYERKSVNSDDLLELLKMLNPKNTQDRVHSSQHTLNFSNSNSEEKVDLSEGFLCLSQSSVEGRNANLISDEKENSPPIKNATQKHDFIVREDFQRDLAPDAPIASSTLSSERLGGTHKICETGDSLCGRDSPSIMNIEKKSKSLLCLNKKIRTQSSDDEKIGPTECPALTQPSERGDDGLCRKQSGCTENPIVINNSQDQVCVVSSSSDLSKRTPTPSDDIELVSVVSPTDSPYTMKPSELGEHDLASQVEVNDEDTNLMSDLEVWEEDCDVYKNKRNASISDIDAVLSDEEVPSSHIGEPPDDFSSEEDCPLVPNIEAHIQRRRLKLCVVKLYKEKELNVDDHQIFT
ncbi:hypothetical protein ScPMuIL_000893 [Solemya velum]